MAKTIFSEIEHQQIGNSSGCKQIRNNETTNAEPHLGVDVVYLYRLSYSRSTVKLQRVSSFRPFTLAERTTV